MEIDHPLLGNYEIIKKIGQGSFASVYLAKHSVLHYPVAIKVYQRSCYEEKIHKSIIHPFICQDFDTVKLPNGQNVIIMEYVDGETLLDYVNNHPSLSEEVIKNIFGQLVIAIDYLHKNHIIHRDLKCENIMIDKNQNIRLIDLDFSCPNVDSHSTMCGSPGYIAPEMINKDLYGNTIDIWALGVIIYAITYGTLPFNNQNIAQMVYLVTSTEPYYPIGDGISSKLLFIIKKMLIKNPDERITIDEIKKDPFFVLDSENNECSFNEQNVNCLIIDPYSKTIQESSIFEQMNLTPKETINAINEIKSSQETYNSMTYTILYKQFGSKNIMNCVLKKHISESLLPLLNNDTSLNNKLMTSSSHFQLTEIIVKKKGETKYNFNILKKRPVCSRLLPNNQIKFRHFSSMAKPLPCFNVKDLNNETFSHQLKNQINNNKKNKGMNHSTFISPQA